ncbi:lytic murein transglycosylase [Blastochloris viridis]|uniref:Membrane-bound lytic murein transglycosylase B n=1 Tax=Blastochloris viridis TaxID=1079 RepID=A0A0H5B9U8_BLAVI|nr:lytic murein transglycosylase [Blastochloris viridis]ALK11062.1 Membrane-bound lytic murein transglycosylase B precursor [Blastochloris viridis]BAR98950.1 membrane-bound lytic murein transglycosylase B precursor [Blastochloris viridis]CUU43724.1 Membrane-bound lytic murein transglycosylase B precursor [Blastochloris viridis]
MARIAPCLALAAVAAATPALAVGPVDGPPLPTACVDSVKAEARTKGVPEAVLERAFRGLLTDASVVGFLQNQPEFRTPAWDYVAALVDDEKITEGKRLLREHAALLARLEARYGVDAATIVAVWGIESDYGKTVGLRHVVRSLATLACTAPRRRDYFRTELIAALRVAATGEIPYEALYGSWAGAFGGPQLMPTVFFRVAVDGDGDGKRDVARSVPDVLASIANFVRINGWQAGLPWGVEVALPDAVTESETGRLNRKPVAAWAAAGVRRVDGRALGGSLATDAPAAIILPAGRRGPAFLVTRNFEAFYRYNPTIVYALSIGHLADRLRGGSPITTPWPTTERPLDRAGRRELQTLLMRSGFDIGGVADGVIGRQTVAAIRTVQQRNGLPVTGRATADVLEALRRGR